VALELNDSLAGARLHYCLALTVVYASQELLT